MIFEKMDCVSDLGPKKKKKEASARYKTRGIKKNPMVLKQSSKPHKIN